jgi:thymidylate synthase
MKAYIDLLKHILENGDRKEDRTNTGTISSFGHQLSFDLSEGFPAVTTKSLAWKGVVSELLWFLEGSSDERRLAEIRFNKNRKDLTDLNKFSTIWTDNADSQGRDLGYENTEVKKELGPVYGVQWREWDGKDQIKDLLEGLKNNPDSRRHILSAWNVGKIEKMALPPCHVMSQFYVNNGTISCHMYQRSADMFLGVPFNIASYALLLSIFGKILGLKPKKFVHSFGDAHIYLNSIDQVKEQISRKPYNAPTLELPELQSIEELSSYTIDDFQLRDYRHHKTIKAKMAI